MDNLIDREVLLREMEKLYNEHAIDAYMTGDKEIRVSWNDAVYLVTAAPTVEAEPTKHGRWKAWDLTWGRSIYVCTNCGEAFEVPTEVGKPIYDYCPNCGAKMDLDEAKE